MHEKCQRPGHADFGPLRTREGVDPTEPVLLKALGSPKPSAATFYLYQEGDHAVSWEDYARPRGRKLYWHQPIAREEAWRYTMTPVEASDQEKQRRLVELAKPDTVLSGTVHFSNLTSVDLGLLLCSLAPCLLDEPAGLAPPRTMMLKLGMGKPLGLGSVKAAVELELIDRTARHATLASNAGLSDAGELKVGAFVDAFLDEIGGAAALQEAPLDDLCRLLDFKALPEDGAHLSYPTGLTARHKGFEWFERWAQLVENRRPDQPMPVGKIDPLLKPEQVVDGQQQRRVDE